MAKHGQRNLSFETIVMCLLNGLISYNGRKRLPAFCDFLEAYCFNELCP